MIIKFFILSVFYFCTYGYSIGTVSETQPVNESVQQDDLFPDWVPFKNKHGDELGFKTVKNKVKKRLAPPINFLMRNLEPEGDYFGGLGDGSSDSEDYFEKKDWSDLHRPAEIKDKVTLHHSALSDIDGVVSILTKEPDHPLAKVINVHVDNYRDRPGDKTTLDYDETQPVVESTESKIVPNDSEQKKIENLDKKTEEQENTKNEEENSASTETKNGIIRPEESNKEEEYKDEADEERKRVALDSVDELKLRHAEEQKDISDRAKEEELYKELFKKYNGPVDNTKDKPHRRKINNQLPDYDEYDDQSTSINEKYKMKPIQKEINNPDVYTSTHPPSTESLKPKTSKYFETGKLSVFRNPQLYMIYDDDDTTTVKPRKTLERTMKYSSYKGTTVPTVEEEERISLVPADSKEGEPTLFLPTKNKRKNRKFKGSATTPSSTKLDQQTYDITAINTAPDGSTSDIPATDRYETERSKTDRSETDKSATDRSAIDRSAIDRSATDRSATDRSATDRSVTDRSATDRSATDRSATDISATDRSATDRSATDTSAADTQQTVDITGPTAIEAVTSSDADKSASDQHKKVEQGDYHNKKGAGKEHYSEYDEEHEEHGKKAYEGQHEDHKTIKGHHDKEDHLGKYDDHGGLDKQHHDEAEHYGGHHHEEHGKKHAKYEESGKHSKGHSTKGSHDIHKKEEYEKKVEFFEEEGDEDDEEKHGGYSHEREHSKGGHFKNGNLQAGHNHKSKGETGKFDKGRHVMAHKGHKLAAGQDGHGKHHKDYFEKAGEAGGKKWIYHHGSPAKTANLVVIDRRGEQFYHGPHYYG